MNNSTHKLLPDVPDDYISDIKIFENKILVTAWDGTLSVYEVNNESTEVTLSSRVTHNFPLLTSCMIDSMIYVGSVQGELLKYDLEKGALNQLFNNDDDNQIAQLGICKMFQCKDRCLLAASWDGILQFINTETYQLIKVIRLAVNVKVLTMDCDGEQIVIVTTGNKIRWLKNLFDESSQDVEIQSPLKFQIRDIKLTTNGTGYVVSSIDGRVAVEYFEDQSKQFAFRCHRMNLTDTQFVFPVNTLAFLPKSNTLYTGGSDGCVSCWSLDTKRKIRQYARFDSNSVVKLCCSEKALVIATSDDSFKTNATVTSDIELQSSNIYIDFF
ncbi:hypothetical protein KAFR_0C05880 [Kazachstania africana CBS 2517]|uniref:Uncharacterized protein n=1 Tax=Kazachstania africana (strain ATCC 22294 / BCRC 22015 / CBS 2517 / CECT 1963 / NBRC 1671 / NRRL Y-8276) TaxID=1071382 RepID=H2AT79_KAZAF|nr:hypothetical protein KAFR_0C05880 [Kazachstania africana CBS 2517]CCF57579.1 hypothetical protein KAFR_0C05880 [Kazachstania africana CBS 2517]